MPIKRGDDELDRVLRQQFPGATGGGGGKPKKRKPAPPGGVAGYELNDQGRVPGVAYVGGTQTQRTGAAGALERYISDQFAGAKETCPPWLNARCLDVLSRWLEQTLKNTQTNSRNPSHIDPPFRAIELDSWNNTKVTLPHGSYVAPGAWTTVTSFTISQDHRGAIIAAGQAVEVTPAWGNVEWRMVISGYPHRVYQGIRLQLFEFCPISPLHHRVNLGPGQQIAWEARNWSPVTDYAVWARLVGWYYPVRSEDGASIRATIVD